MVLPLLLQQDTVIVRLFWSLALPPGGLPDVNKMSIGGRKKCNREEKLKNRVESLGEIESVAEDGRAGRGRR